MAGKRPPAPRQEDAPRTIPVHRPGPPERQAHNVVAAVLRKHYGPHTELPDADTWRHAAMFFADYAQQPWDDAEGAKHTEGLRKHQRERRILQNAARILLADFDRLPPTKSPEAVAIPLPRALQIAIGVLKSAREPIAHDPDGVSEQGPAMKGSSHVTRMLARLLAPPLRALDVPVSTRKTSRFVKSLQELLVLIYGEENAPSCSAISKAITNFGSED